MSCIKKVTRNALLLTQYNLDQTEIDLTRLSRFTTQQQASVQATEPSVPTPTFKYVY